MLQADILNSEFLKQFLPETVYLLPEEDFTSVVSTATTEQEPVVPVQTFAAQPAPVASTSTLPTSGKATTASNRYDVIGESRKGVVILVTLPEQEFKQLPQLEFLQKILSAIGLQPSDVAYVNNLTGEVADFEELQQLLPMQYIISFASRIDTNLPHEKFTLYNPVVVGQVPVIFSQALSMLKDNVEHKKYLWGALRQVFLK